MKAVMDMLDFLYHLPENLWKTLKMGLCLTFIYFVVTNILIPGFARMFNFG